MPEAASVALTNPALPGDVPFDTIIYAAAGLVYPAPHAVRYLLDARSGLHHTPDQHRRVRQSGRRCHLAACQQCGSAQRPCACRARRGPFPPVRARESSAGGELLARLSVSGKPLARTVIAATIDVNFLNGRKFRRERWRDCAPRTSQAVPDLEQHGRSSAARTGGPEPHHDRGPFPGRRGRGARLVLQPAFVDSAGQHQSRGAAGRIGSAPLDRIAST